jgi:SnoaL-like domain
MVIGGNLPIDQFPRRSPTISAVEPTPREAIAELVHRYADAVVHRNGEQWGSCWAEDARWILSADRDVLGREAIVALWHKAMGNFAAVVQNVYNGEVTMGDDGLTASARWYIGEHFLRSNGTTGILLAYYNDTYAYIDGSWLFTSRQLFPQYQGPPDLSAPFLNAVASS